MIDAHSKKNRYLKLFGNIFTVAVLGFLVWYLYENREVFDTVKNISWQHVSWIILLDLTLFLLNSLLDKSMINQVNPKVGYLDCYLLQYANNFLNKILPTVGGGATFKAIFLKKKYMLPYSRFVSTLTGLYVISFFSVSLIGILCMITLYFQLELFNWIIFVAFLGIMSSCMFVILFSPNIPESKNRLLKLLQSTVEGWKILQKNIRLIFIYIGLSIMLLIISALQTYVSYRALGVEIGVVPIMFLSTLGIITALLNFTPDGIGVKEGIYIFSANLVQIPEETLVLGSLVLRGISICTTFIFGGISYFILMKQMKSFDIGEEQ